MSMFRDEKAGEKFGAGSIIITHDKQGWRLSLGNNVAAFSDFSFQPAGLRGQKYEYL